MDFIGGAYVILRFLRDIQEIPPKIGINRENDNNLHYYFYQTTHNSNEVHFKSITGKLLK